MRLAPQEHIAALAATLTAIRAGRRHIAIRPQGSGILGFRLPTQTKTPGAALDDAVEEASSAGQDDSTWELLGADYMQGIDGWEAGGGWDPGALWDGDAGDPTVYGRFSTLGDGEESEFPETIS